MEVQNERKSFSIINCQFSITHRRCPMKIQFDPNLDFQKQAIESVAGVFEGQEICQTNFTVAPLQYTTQQVIPGMENNLGIGNRLKLLPEDIHKNIRKIQLQNGLAPSEKMDSMDFTVDGDRDRENLCLSALDL